VDLRSGHVDAPHYRQGSKKLMLALLIFAVGVVMVLVLVLLAIVVIGMRQEPPTKELSMQAPSLLAASIRRILGVYVRKPDPSPDDDTANRALLHATREEVKAIAGIHGGASSGDAARRS
jgi:hypothetical protein